MGLVILAGSTRGRNPHRLAVFVTGVVIYFVLFAFVLEGSSRLVSGFPTHPWQYGSMVLLVAGVYAASVVGCRPSPWTVVQRVSQVLLLVVSFDVFDLAEECLGTAMKELANAAMTKASVLVVCCAVVACAAAAGVRTALEIRFPLWILMVVVVAVLIASVFYTVVMIFGTSRLLALLP